MIFSVVARIILFNNKFTLPIYRFCFEMLNHFLIEIKTPSIFIKETETFSIYIVLYVLILIY